ncbi:T9SS type A sorting domain-containing protein [Formosa sp. Hel1_31_208]|uniref:T9SS type A sorting domain-containing protein n=1 Tax=Formosa sp. Hel1_31_208 TaxID=1798225 RepID=UPI0012FD4EB9|nr:T9SS type A sorting domain-containing protein [Formosa sp. Hel1_31_208]
MSNFTRSGRRAKIWQSITNLSCCSIDLMTKQSRSMKTLVLLMLLTFSTSSLFAQQSFARSTEISGCLSDAPDGFTVAEVQNLYSGQEECAGVTPEVTITVTEEGNDCGWTKEITYDVKCGAFEEQFKIEYFGADGTAPELNGDAEVPTGGSLLVLCYDDIPEGPSIADITALYSDNCGEVNVTKSGSPEGSDCSWTVTYKYTISDDCGNFADDLDVTYSGGDTEAPMLGKDVELPPLVTDSLNQCFLEKEQGPTEEDIAALFVDNCGNVNVVKTGVSKGDDCKWMAEYTYTISDDCGNFVPENLVLTYYGGDFENPTLTGVPEDVEVTCADLIPAPDTKNVSGADNCTDKVDVVVTDDESQFDGTCFGGTILRTYSVTDDCGRTTSQIQTITVLPTPPAVFDPVQDMEITCEEANVFEPGFLSYSNGGAGACDIKGSVEGVLSGSYTECGGTLEVDYTFTDECERTITAKKVVTVLPAPMASFTEVQNLSITCEAAALYEAQDLAYTNGGTGACEISGSVAGELSGTYDECGGTLFVNWTFTDDCNRTITAQKEVNVEPAPAAEFDEIQDMEITCEEANSLEPGSLGYSNGGSGACEISGSVTGELSGSYDECGGTLEVDWTYTDDCQRTITAKKTITVLPAPAAEFDAIQDMEISCEEANSFEPGSLGYSNGGTGACEISGSVVGELSGSYTECGGTLYVDWTYTDDCQRTITAKKTITVLAAPAAEFDAIQDMEISCEEANSFEPSSLSYTNGGTGACEISGSVPGELSGSYDECGGELFVDWTYTDACQRTITAKKTITVLPAPQAQFEAVENITITCEEANSFQAGSLSYTNGGTGACEISGSVLGELSGTYDECGGVLFIDWTYTDDCERTITAHQQVKVNPAPAAVFEDVFDMEISCEDANVFEPGSLSYTNGGTGACEISGSVVGELSGSYTECGGTLEVDWTFTDKCDRTITAKKVITVLPAPAAEFTEVQNLSITCEDAALYEAQDLAYTNGGTGACEISGSVPGELSGTYDECGGTLFVNWTYTDACERTITAQKEVTVEPAPMAEFEQVDGFEITCEEANTFQAGSLTYSNGGTGACEISGSVTGEATPDYDECGGVILVNWTYTDDCNRTITASNTVTVLPAPAAAFEDVIDMTISCEEAAAFVDDFSTGFAGDFAPENWIQDLGGSDGSINITATDMTIVGGNNGVGSNVIASATCPTSGVYSFSWDFTTDDSSAFWDPAFYVNGVAVIQLTDDGLSAQSGSVSVNCAAGDVIGFSVNSQDGIAGAGTLTISNFAVGSMMPLSYTNGGTGACEISGSVPGELSGTYDECGGTLEVDYTFTDDCNRTITAKKVITVLPAPQAEFEDVIDMEITCEDANVFEPGSLSYTNGGTGTCEISGSVEGELSGSYDECGGTLEVDWTYTDDCNRTITAKKVITVLPAPQAEFEAVEDMTISCEEAAAFVSSTLVEDFTNPGVITAFEGLASAAVTADPQDGNNQVLELISQAAGNPWQGASLVNNIDLTNTKSVKIDVLADQAFDILVKVETSPDDFAETAGSYTNVGQWQTITVSFEQDQLVNGNIGDQAYGLLALFPGWDAAANTWAEPSDFTIYVDNVVVGGPGCLSYTNGGTGACEISGEVAGEVTGSYDECGGILEVDYTFTDDCNRTITAKKTITVEPAPMAAFDPVEDMTVSCEEAAAVVINATIVEGFVGDFAPGNWSINTGGTDGTIAITATDMTITGAADGSNDVPVIATATCPTSGNYSFSWDFNTTDSAFWDPAFYVNGVAVIELTDSNGPDNQSGSVSVNCAAGDVIGFSVTSQDGVAGPGVLTISDFVVGGTFLNYTNGGNGACEIAGSVPAVLSGSYDECGGTLFLDWTYTDDCNRTITAQKVITVEPAPEAVFAEIIDVTIACEDLATYEPQFLSYSNGGTGACEIAGEVQGEADAFEGSCGTFEVNFTYTDDCNRTITAKHVVTVVDETAPMLVGEAPGGESFIDACFADRPVGPSIATIIELFEDNCGNVNVTKEETIVESSDCQWAVFYVYTISDDCDNFANNIKISYFGGDDSAPVLVGTLPTGVTGLQCLSDNPGVSPEVMNQIAAAYTETCGEVLVSPLEPIIEGTDCAWTATYTFTVEDSCGNFADNVTIVNSGADTMKPVYNGELDDSFTNTTLCFDAELGEPSAEDMRAMFSDNCTSTDDLIITKTVQEFGSDCQWLKVFIYTAEDACGLISDPVKINYEGLDEEAPTGGCPVEAVVIGTDAGAACPADAVISLQQGDEVSAGDTSWTVAGVSIGDIGQGTAFLGCYTDNCADEDELIFRVVSNVATPTDDCSTTIVLTMEVEDLCGNVSLPFDCTFIIVDDTDPIVECPEGQDFGVVTQTPSGFADKAPYTDNCQVGGDTQDFSDNLTSVVNEGSAAETYTENFDGLFAPSLFSVQNTSTNDYFTSPYASLTAGNWEVLDTSTFNCAALSTPNSLVWNTAQSSADVGGNDPSATISFAVPAFDVSFAIADNTLVEVTVNHDGGTSVLSVNGNGDAGNIVTLTETGITSLDFVVQDFGNNYGCLDNLTYSVGSVPTRDYTLVRTFTANDGCDNTASCDVTYTWSVELSTCDNAEVLDCGAVVSGDTSVTGGPQVDGQDCTSFGEGLGQWYTVVGTGSPIVVSTCSENTTYDTYLSAYSDCGITCVADNDDTVNDTNCVHSNLHSQIEFDTVAGEEYKIFVSGFAGGTGAFELSVECLDACEVAAEIACGDVISGDTSVTGVPEYDNQDCTSIGSNSGDWYTLVGTGQTATISTCSANTTYDTYLSVYSDCGVTCVANNDDTSNDTNCIHSNLHSQIVFDTVEGQEYKVFVSGFNGQTGAYELSVTCETLPTIVECGGPGETVEVLSTENNQFLEWAFTSSTGDPLTINFDGSTEAGFDFIFVYDGLDATAPFLGAFDGNLTGQSVTTTGDSVYVTFDSDSSVSGFTFAVNASCETGATIVECGGPGETVEVLSTENNQFLEWAFTSSTGDPLTINFDGSTEAGFDFIFVYDGLDATAPFLGAFDGNLTGQSVTTTGDSVYVTFDSDSSVSGFTFAVNASCETGATIVECGGPGETVEVIGTENNQFLEWAFTSSTGDPLTINFDGSTEAGFDFIFVYDGLDATAPFLGAFDGNLTGQSVTTTGDSVYVTFDSDSSVSGFTFAVNASCETGATIVECGGPGETVEVIGTENNQFLEWAFTSSTGDPLTINFDGSTEAGFDFIFVYDGLDATAPFLGAFDGNLIGQSVTTTGDSVYVTFDSDSSVSGFTFAVNVACGAPQARTAGTEIDFTAYPVPFDKEVNIAYSFEFETNVTIELFDTKGLLVFTETNTRYVTGSKGTSTFDLSRYSNQLFYVKLTTNQGSVTKKIVSSGKK